MRKLMWFTIGFTIACALDVYLGVGIWLAVVGAVLAGIFLLLNNHNLKFIAVIAIGLTVVPLWLWGYNGYYLSSVDQFDGKTVESKIVASDYSFDTDFGTAVDGNIQLVGKNYQVRLYLNTKENLCPGDIVSGNFRFRLTIPNSLQGSTYHQGKGIFILAYGRGDLAIQKADKVPIQYYPSFLRHQITDLLDSIFSDDVLSFARALLLGDGSLLSYEVDTAFKISGIRHIIAVSGLHVSILFALVYLFSGKRRILTALIGIPTLILFAAVAGFTPSVVRACVMQGLIILSLLFKKEYDPPTSLAFAVLVMLAVNPLTITSVSFQLSVGCICGIFLLYQPFYNYLLRVFGQPKGLNFRTRLIRGLCASIAVSVSATVATTPLSAIYFGTVSIVGVVTNLLTLWVVSFIFYGIMLSCILGAFWLPAGILVGKFVSIPIRYVLLVAKILSKPHFAALYTTSRFVVLFLIFAYILFFAFLMAKKKHPVLFTVCVAIGLCATLFLSWLMPRLDNYRMTVLDVGQGQAVLFQSKGKTYLVDCGGDNGDMTADIVAGELLSQGITSLDGIILTHYDDDHAGGVQSLMCRIDVQKLYLPDIMDNGSLKKILQQQYANKIVWIAEETKIQEVTMEFSLYPGDKETDDAQSSMCVLFRRENCAILLTGDRNQKGEQLLLEYAQIPKLDVLVVGHHGSNSSTDLSFLYETKPDVAVISVGKDNDYGHPAEEVLYRLNLFGCQIYRTDMDGTILFRG